MDQPQTGYLAYLLRLRYVDNACDPVWRITLESPDRAQCITLRGLDELVGFLQAQMGWVERRMPKENEA